MTGRYGLGSGANRLLCTGPMPLAANGDLMVSSCAGVTPEWLESENHNLKASSMSTTQNTFEGQRILITHHARPHRLSS